jgi:hypothetical protein
MGAPKMATASQDPAFASQSSQAAEWSARHSCGRNLSMNCYNGPVGPKPKTPLVDLYNEGASQVIGGTLEMVGGITTVASAPTLLSSTVSSPTIIDEATTNQPVHGNSLKSTKTTYLYELLDEEGNHLKYGITSETNPLDRYSRAFLVDKRMVILDWGSRREIYSLEHELILNNPRGPLQVNMH